MLVNVVTMCVGAKACHQKRDRANVRITCPYVAKCEIKQ